MKKKLIFGISILLLLVIPASLLAYKAAERAREEREYYEWATSTFEVDAGSIQDLDGETFSYLTRLDEILPQTIPGNNMLGEDIEFEVGYYYKEIPLDTHMLFNLMQDSNIDALRGEQVKINYEVIDHETEGYIILRSEFDNVFLEPIIIDTSLDLEEAIPERLTMHSTECSFSFEVKSPHTLEGFIVRVYDGLPFVNAPSQIGRLTVIDKELLDIENYDIFNEVYIGGLEVLHPVYLTAVEEAFNNIPLDLQIYMLLSGMTIVGEDIGNISQEIADSLNRNYSDHKTPEQYGRTLMGLYWHPDRQVTLTTRRSFYHYPYVNSLQSGVSYTFEHPSKHCVQTKGGSTTRVSTVAGMREQRADDLARVFLHEVGHFLDFSSTYSYRLSPVQMDYYRAYYHHGYENNYPMEHIADAFAVYLSDPEFLKSEVPEMYETLIKILDGINMSQVDAVYETIEWYKAQ